MAALPGLLAVHHVTAALHSSAQLESAPFLQQLKPPAHACSSDGHRVNLMGCGFDTLGTGVAINDTSAYKIYYTQDFGCSRQDYDCTCPEVSLISGSAGMSSIFEA